MHSNVNVRGIRFKILANEQTRLAMGIAFRSQPLDGRLQSEVTGHFFPKKVKGITGEPHILTTPGNQIRTRSRIEAHRACLSRISDFRLACEKAKFFRRAITHKKEEEVGEP